MDETLRGASTLALEELVDALLQAANCRHCREDEAAQAREIMQRLGLACRFGDWQEAYDAIGIRALEILRVRYTYGIDRPM
jgi:hypothetical protein